MSTAMTQMNTRLEAQLKDSGDQALSLANRTPSQAVRWLWEYLSIHKNDPDALRFLDGDPADAHIEAGLSVDRDKVSSLHTLVDDI